MEIRLKSNRRFIMNICIPFIVIYTCLFALMIVGPAAGWFALAAGPGDLGILITVIIQYVLLIWVLICAKYHKGRSYRFTGVQIEIYDKGILTDTQVVSEIESMHYYPWRWHYVITIFLGALNEGGAMKIHVKTVDDNQYELGFIGEKDARRIQAMYPDKFTIFYERKSRTK